MICLDLNKLERYVSVIKCFVKIIIFVVFLLIWCVGNIWWWYLWYWKCILMCLVKWFLDVLLLCMMILKGLFMMIMLLFL